MLYLKVSCSLHVLGEYLYKDDDLNQDGVVIKEESLPIHNLFDEESGKYDVYSLSLWGRGVKCKQVDTNTYNYVVDTSTDFYALLDWLKDKTEKSSELFDYSRNQRINDFYIEIRVESVNQSLLENYFCFETMDKYKWKAYFSRGSLQFPK
jgi:hypothetical protein